jgi:hypothetical protein
VCEVWCCFCLEVASYGSDRGEWVATIRSRVRVKAMTSFKGAGVLSGEGIERQSIGKGEMGKKRGAGIRDGERRDGRDVGLARRSQRKRKKRDQRVKEVTGKINEERELVRFLMRMRFSVARWCGNLCCI